MVSLEPCMTYIALIPANVKPVTGQLHGWHATYQHVKLLGMYHIMLWVNKKHCRLQPSHLTGVTPVVANVLNHPLLLGHVIRKEWQNTAVTLSDRIRRYCCCHDTKCNIHVPCFCFINIELCGIATTQRAASIPSGARDFSLFTAPRPAQRPTQCSI